MFVRTERLLLRPGWTEDAPALAAAIGEERIVRNLARAPWPHRLSDAECFLASPDAALPRFLIFVREGAEPALIGGIGLERTHDGAVELGYWIVGARCNRGFATEAGRAVLDLARHGLRLDRIVAGHFIDNPASGRVLEKLGFAATGGTDVRHSRARGEAAAFRGYALETNAIAARADELIAA